MRKGIRIVLKGIKIFFISIFASILLLLISTPFVNDFSAHRTMADIASLPLPRDTRIAERFSRAGKLVGSGNGMQFLGALLLESELPLEELEKHYSAYREKEWEYVVEVQDTQAIQATEHRYCSFKTDVTNGQYYIVYTWGNGISPFQDLDIRGH